MTGLINSSMKVVVFFILVASVKVIGQDNGQSIQINILDTALVVNTVDAKIAFELQCKNKLKSTLLLYGFNGSFGGPPAKIERLCDYIDNMSAGCALYIYDSALKKRGPKAYLRKSFHYQPMPKSRLDSIMAAQHLQYLEATEVVKGFSTMSVKIEMDLHEYELEQGTYYLQIAYFSGKEISARVEEDQIMKDMKTFDAILFQGCVLSNRVMFRVE